MMRSTIWPGAGPTSRGLAARRSSRVGFGQTGRPVDGRKKSDHAAHPGGGLCRDGELSGLAAATARRALDLAARQKNDTLAATLQKEIKLYEAGTPLRDAPQ